MVQSTCCGNGPCGKETESRAGSNSPQAQLCLLGAFPHRRAPSLSRCVPQSESPIRKFIPGECCYRKCFWVDWDWSWVTFQPFFFSWPEGGKKTQDKEIWVNVSHRWNNTWREDSTVADSNLQWILFSNRDFFFFFFAACSGLSEMKIGLVDCTFPPFQCDLNDFSW